MTRLDACPNCGEPARAHTGTYCQNCGFPLVSANPIPRRSILSGFAIDLPNPSDPEAAWVTYGYYESREQALAAARHHFGADEQGRIQLVSELHQEDE